MRGPCLLLLVLAALRCTRNEPGAAELPAPAAGELRAPEEFAAIADPAERSRALFREAYRVFKHPRCANCHPAGDTPLQGIDGRPHDPPVARGPDDRGVVGLRCRGCHQDTNLALARVPGAPEWHLAPLVMSWTDKGPRALCRQLKDPARNGGKDLRQLAEHSAHDPLVAWGWAPGHGREPAPGTQARFGALVAAWADTGAECPGTEDRR